MNKYFKAKVLLHLFRYLDIEKINKDKKKNRSGKKSFEKFKAKCKLRKEEKKKQNQLEKSIRDEEKRIIDQKKKKKIIE